MTPLQTVAPPEADTIQARPLAARPPASPELSPDDAATVLRLARAGVTAAAGARMDTFDPRSLLPDRPPASLLEPAAVFVTLRTSGELRGCIGSLAADRPLWKAVISAAMSAAAHDPRFPPVAEHEIPSLTIDVSVLGPAVALEDRSGFQPGTDGLIVERGLRRGLLLPEVAIDQGWGAREMLAATCWKAGLPMSAWHDPNTRVLAFRTTRVSDADEGCDTTSW